MLLRHRPSLSNKMSSTQPKQLTNLFPHLPPYTPPQHGLLSCLPSSWVPYAELMRLSRPIGIIIIYSPYLFGTLFAAAVSKPHPPPQLLFKTNVILFIATVLLRGGAVAFNDLADREIDGRIARTRHRPLARKAISPRNGYIFVAAQAIIWLAIVAQLSQRCIGYAIPLLGLVGLYPYSKRVTDFTPVVLGFTVAWGVFVGCAAMGVDPANMVVNSATPEAYALCCFYLSCALWTNIYETIYAHQDIQDDEKQGVRSMAVRLKGREKSVLSILATLQIGLLACTGWLIHAGPAYFIGTCFGVAVSLGVMIRQVDLRQPSECWWWFANGTWFVGGSILVGFLGEMWGEDMLQYAVASIT
ncbi:hypothetical protein N7G274_000395 [Stereocaulon virgatum]|uniref:Para-hydroxybenzoate--polyprenyltransferase n=1 Tax=Stereocaulon virgatum TaxID=373712 RepID=A0ABR4ATM7_9LECA